WRLYDALATLAGVGRPVTVDDPRVLAAELRHRDGRSLVWLISQRAPPAPPTSRRPRPPWPPSTPGSPSTRSPWTPSASGSCGGCPRPRWDPCDEKGDWDAEQAQDGDRGRGAVPGGGRLHRQRLRFGVGGEPRAAAGRRGAGRRPGLLPPQRDALHPRGPGAAAPHTAHD